jgi:hypothetical protein
VPVIRIRTQTRLHKAARLELMGINDARIADICGLSPAGLATLKQRPEYKVLLGELQANVITQMDEELAKDVGKMHQEFASAVPAAMRTLVDAAMQKKDLKAAIAASTEILDRDPKMAFAKPKDKVAAEENSKRDLPKSVYEGIITDSARVIVPTQSTKAN